MVSKLFSFEPIFATLLLVGFGNKGGAWKINGVFCFFFVCGISETTVFLQKLALGGFVRVHPNFRVVLFFVSQLCVCVLVFIDA